MCCERPPSSMMTPSHMVFRHKITFDLYRSSHACPSQPSFLTQTHLLSIFFHRCCVSIQQSESAVNRHWTIHIYKYGTIPLMSQPVMLSVFAQILTCYITNPWYSRNLILDSRRKIALMAWRNLLSMKLIHSVLKSVHRQELLVKFAAKKGRIYPPRCSQIILVLNSLLPASPSHLAKIFSTPLFRNLGLFTARPHHSLQARKEVGDHPVLLWTIPVTHWSANWRALISEGGWGGRISI